MRLYSRRRFSGLLAFLLGSLWRPAPQASAASPPTQRRRYRADATILLLGIPLIRRSGVGGGEASVEESDDGVNTTRKLFFAAGSDPARARGLNRVGWIREVVQISHAAPVKVDYFGVMTSSPEESLEHAKKSMSGPSGGLSTYSAVSGRNLPGSSRSAITHFELPGAVRWSDKQLIDAAESAFQQKVEWRDTPRPASANQATPTFLLELATLLNQRVPQASGTYVYNEQEYGLELKAESKPDKLLAVRGKIRNQRTRGVTTFTVWMDRQSGSLIPVRIEYQARSFLRLVFEAVE